MGVLLFEAISGVTITCLPFHAVIQWTVIVHTLAGTLVLLPLGWYVAEHWRRYRPYAASQITVLGYLGLAALLLCAVSGLVLTWQGFFGIRTQAWWRKVHLITTLVAFGSLLPHVLFSYLHQSRDGQKPAAGGYLGRVLAVNLAGVVLIATLTLVYSGTHFNNQLPSDYSYLYGTNRPFAPSLARTDTGGAFDERSLAGSASCGTAGCHSQILEEWKPSAHRYAAMDTVFAGIQNVMAKQNGPESTRYCGGCHDPISLFSGAKNIFAANLTSLPGYQEGISCLACHAIRETDLKGNANYTVTQPHEYLWQWQLKGLGRTARDFLIRTYPQEHAKLSKRMFKKPEYCAACHKQFIDQEVNRVGWVQLQNQYDNWAASHWNHKGDSQKTVECRECHMPLVDSVDPAAGDDSDYNRRPNDRKHRSHRFIASNELMPRSLKLEGWEQQVRLTEQWLQGKQRIPEIAEKWSDGPIVKVALDVPQTIDAGQTIPLRVIMTSNKVGHDYPTGPLDLIQSWLEVHVTDTTGKEVFSSGKRDTNNFITPGTFLFKAEPVDQNGNLIDRHNLWEMVGVRFRRSIFPGYSDTAQFSIPCTGTLAQDLASPTPQRGQTNLVQMPSTDRAGTYRITASLQYRKVDQFLLNYLFGDENRLTSAVTEIDRATASVEVKRNSQAANLAEPTAQRLAQASEERQK
jgi:cytochrome c554/c'-like protein